MEKITWFAENGTVYNDQDDFNSIIVIYNRDTGSYMTLPYDVAEKVADLMNEKEDKIHQLLTPQGDKEE